MGYLNNRRGFTLVELIVVILIISIFATLAVPRISGYIESTNISEDQAKVKILNKATRFVRLYFSGDDPFKDTENSDQELMQKLADEGHLFSIIVPKTKDAKFKWNFNQEKWYLWLKDSSYIITLPDGLILRDTDGHKNFLKGSYTGESKEILIPVSIDGIDIKHIWQEVFLNKELISLKFDENSKVERIHARAFRNNNLTSIDFPESLKEIHSFAFENNKLTEIRLSSKLEKMQDHVFANNQLTEVTLPDSLTHIGSQAFEHNPELNKITIGPNLTTIGAEVFDYRLNNITTKRDFKVSDYENGKVIAGIYIWNGSAWIRQ